VTAPLAARGAPRDQGIAQGAAWADAIRSRVRAQVERHGRIAWWDLRRAAARGPLRSLRSHVAQLHERMEGIALGAQASLGDLAVLWATTSWASLGGLCGRELEARLALPAELAGLALLRRSEPDGGGLASLELALAPFPGCLAGVNERGVGVAVLEERGALEVPLRSLAQDLLLRASSLASGLAHLRLRARYASPSGLLLLADASGEAVQVALARGECALRPAASSSASCAASTVRIDLAERSVALDLGPAPPLRAQLGGESAPGHERSD
jgi:hypothetical protein